MSTNKVSLIAENFGDRTQKVIIFVFVRKLKQLSYGCVKSSKGWKLSNSTFTKQVSLNPLKILEIVKHKKLLFLYFSENWSNSLIGCVKSSKD